MAREMKESGIPWIGVVPAHWLCRKLKAFLAANDGGVWGNDPKGNETDKIVIRSTEQTIDGKWCITDPAIRDLSGLDYRKSRIVKDDLLITKSSGSDLHIGKTTLAGEYFVQHECYFSNFIQRIRCSGYNPKLLWYLFNSPIIRSQCVFLQNSTSGLGNINAEIIRNLYIPVPPTQEQNRLVDFLDAKCALIDEITEKTRTAIEEYKKLKQSMITEAVTKGIRPGRKMKDSGIDWIGEFPEEWRFTKTLNCLAMPITDGPHTTPELFDEGIAFISAEAVSCGNGRIDFSHKRGYISQSFYEECCKKYIPQMDDIYMIKSGATTGRVAMVDALEPVFTIWSPLAVFRCNREMVLPRFMFYALQSDGFQKQVEFGWTFGTQQNIGMRTLEQLKVCVPPVEEQAEIVEYLDSKCVEIDRLLKMKQQLVTELDAYKKSLIYEYVTGKKEVPAAVADSESPSLRINDAPASIQILNS